MENEKLYGLDPKVMFNEEGYKWACILIEYNDGKRNIKTFPSRENLIAYILADELKLATTLNTKESE